MAALCSCSGHEESTAAVSRNTQTEAGPSGQIKTTEFKVEATNSAIVQATQQSVSSQTSMQSPPHVQSNLPSESLVIQAGGVSTEKVGNLLQSGKFDAFVSRLSAESNKNPLAQDVTAMEKKGLDDFFGEKANLRNFACGTSVCAGTVAMGKDSSVYKAFSDNFLANGPANASLLDYPVTLDNGDLEQRFVMSVDPNLKGITVPNHP
jgi:hypothetical protein